MAGHRYTPIAWQAGKGHSVGQGARVLQIKERGWAVFVCCKLWFHTLATLGKTVK